MIWLITLLGCAGFRHRHLAGSGRRRRALAGGWVAMALLSAASIQAKEKWLLGRSAHFEMLTSGPEREGRELLTELEQFRATFLAFFPVRNVREPKCRIVIFDSDSRFTGYKPLYNGKPKEVAGFFVGGNDQLTIGMTSEHDPDFTHELIFHEYVHQLLYSRGFRPPPWLNEGLAELYSTFKIAGDRAEIGNPKPFHVVLLNRSSLLPLGELFGVRQDSPDYNEGTRRGIFYAQSWALLHMWMCGEDRSYQNKLGDFISLVEQDTGSIEQSFRTAFGLGYEEMAAKLRNYLDGGRYLIRSGALPIQDAKATFSFRPASDVERGVILADLAWRARQPPETTFQLLQLSERNPTSPLPYEALANVAMRERDTRGALDYWRKAVDRDSDNAYAYYMLAADPIRQTSRGTSLDYRLPSDLTADLRKLLDRALELSPNYAEAYEGLAWVEAFSERPRVAALNRIQKHVDLMADRNKTLAALAIVRWRLKDLVTSQEIVSSLLAQKKLPPQVRGITRNLQARLKAAELASAKEATPAVQKDEPAAAPSP
jgi:hypothetical protein